MMMKEIKEWLCNSEEETREEGVDLLDLFVHQTTLYSACLLTAIGPRSALGHALSVSWHREYNNTLKHELLTFCLFFKIPCVNGNKFHLRVKKWHPKQIRKQRSENRRICISHQSGSSEEKQQRQCLYTIDCVSKEVMRVCALWYAFQ